MENQLLETNEIQEEDIALEESEQNINIEDSKKELESLKGIDKLGKAISLMELALSQKSGPDFKTFWESRNLCLELFKDTKMPAIKTMLWPKYKEITKQAKRLQTMFEAETVFAVEQIDIAIKALEKDVNEIKEQLDKMPEPDITKSCRSIKNNFSIYLKIQKELCLLNTFASRVNALRKELIRTKMRIGQKNLFFKTLSSIGDAVFPDRKELIKEISALFSQDVDDFVNKNFSKDAAFEKNLYGIREEIKAFQSVAKNLTLNTNSFTTMRVKLSDCWQTIKISEKELRKTENDFKEIYQNNYNELSEKIKNISQSFDSKEMSATDAKNRLDDINKSIRSTKLGKIEIKRLRDELKIALEPILSLIELEEKKRIQVEQKKFEKKKEQINALEKKISQAFRKKDSLSKDQISKVLTEVENDLAQIEKITCVEREHFGRLIIPLKDVFYAKEEEETLSGLSQDKKDQMKALAQILVSRQKRKNAIKEEIEKLRKTCGGSGLDFEQSMSFNDKLNSEKNRLDDINKSIDEISTQIKKIKKG